MRPLKPKHFIKPTAEATGFSEQIVSDITSFFWVTVRKQLGSLEHHSVTVDNLGNFRARYAKIPMIERKYSTYLMQEPDIMTFNKHAMRKEAEENLIKLEKLRAVIEEEKSRKLEVQQKRKDYELHKGMESQRPDTGRSEEQNI